MAKPIIVALVGPTGVGKTKTSLFLAKELNGRIHMNALRRQIIKKWRFSLSKVF